MHQMRSHRIRILLFILIVFVLNFARAAKKEQDCPGKITIIHFLDIAICLMENFLLFKFACVLSEQPDNFTNLKI